MGESVTGDGSSSCIGTPEGWRPLEVDMVLAR